MEKPKEIIELEKHYGIELKEISTKKNLFDSQNSFHCDKNRNIIELNLSKNKITVISGLDNLTNLTELYLHKNQISSISGLDKLTNLTKLHLSYNQISSISGLDKLKNLTNKTPAAVARKKEIAPNMNIFKESHVRNCVA